jgi:hypothetical protein
MRRIQTSVALFLLLTGVLTAACGGSTPLTASEPNRVDTRVAEELSVAATLTALAPRTDALQASPTRAAELTPAQPAPTLAAIAPVSPPTAPPAPASAIPPTDLPPAASCLVVTAGLNLRPGPGTVYNPPLAALGRNTELRPLSFVARGFPSGQWIEVQVVSNGLRGWVGAGTQFVACNVDVTSLPPGVPPPTPTPGPTATRALLPTETPPPAVAVVPVDGSDGNQDLGNDRSVNSGRNLLLPGFASYEVSTPLVFHDRIVFRAEVFDRQVGHVDGAGIESVTFTIRDETGDTVHQRTERTPGYCVFGGGEPECTVWRFSEHSDKWPGGAPLRPGVHDAQIVIKPKNGDAVTWFWSFRIER